MWNLPSVAFMVLLVSNNPEPLKLMIISSISHFFIIASRAYSAKYVPELSIYYISDSTSQKKWKHLIRFRISILTLNWTMNNSIHRHIRSAFAIFFILNGTNCRWWLRILLFTFIQQSNQVFMELSLLFFKNYVPSFCELKGTMFGKTLNLSFFFYLLSFPQGDFTVWVWFYIKYVSLICTIRKTSSLVSILALLTNERHLSSSVYTIWMTLKRIWLECSYLSFKQISFYLIV